MKYNLNDIVIVSVNYRKTTGTVVGLSTDGDIVEVEYTDRFLGFSRRKRAWMSAKYYLHGKVLRRK